MVAIFIEGFDKYGPASITQNGSVPTLSAMLTAGEWTTAGNTVAIVAPLSSTGQALELNAEEVLTKTLAGNSAVAIGGLRFNSTLTAAFEIEFYDSTTFQCGVEINSSTGTFSVLGSSGGALATSSASVSANTTHYLEWDITIGTSAAYQLWLDGVSILSGTGSTRGSSNNYFNVLKLVQNNSNSCTVDDLYLFDATGSTNNAVLNTNPRIETKFPSNDSSVAFSFGAAIIGQAYSLTTGNSSPGANHLILRKFTPSVSCTIQSVACIPETTSATANYKAVIYSDSGGSPNTLLSSGTQVTGTTAGTTLTGSLVTPQSLTSGTPYWIGFIMDTSIALLEVDSTTTGYTAANTYASGAPSTAPSMTSGQPSWVLYGNVTGTGANYYETDIDPPPGDLSFVYSSTVSQEDLYQFSALSTTPAAIYTVAVKGLVRDATTGARTIDLLMDSGGTISGGSNTGQAPGTTYEWYDSFFPTDPHTSSAWTPSGLNNATSGVEIAS